MTATRAWPASIGIGLPAAVPGGAAMIAAWARRAEERGFSTLGVIDRLLYPNVEPLVALAAAAAVTERVRLAATVLLAPLRSNHVLLAKQVASLDALSGGRLVLGVGVGVRHDDYDVSGVDHGRRGRLLDEQLERLHLLLEEARLGGTGVLGPAVPEGRPEILVGGSSPAAFDRLVRHGDGWISGRAGLEMFRRGAPRARAAWAAAGREGQPHLAALAYYSLGVGARERADTYLGDYYGFDATASEGARRDVAVTPEDVHRLLDAFGTEGCDELVFFPCVHDTSQVHLLADAIGMD